MSKTQSFLSSVLRSRWLSPIVLLAVWETASRVGLIPSHTLAAPSAVAATMIDMIRSGELPRNLIVSFWRVAIGLGIGVTLGVVLALGAGLTRQGEALLDPIMQIKRTIPVVALAPLFIVWFGIGETPKIALIAFATLFPVYLNLYNGIRSVDKSLVEGALSFGLNSTQLIIHVILPGALPSLLVGLRYALTISIVMLVIAEQINASAGLGFLVNNARDFMRTDIIVVCLMVYALLGLGADLIVRLVEDRALAWRPKLVEA